MSPVKRKLAGADITADNSFGYDLSTATSVGAVKYTDAFDILANQDEYDINGIYAPGVIKRLHPYVAQYLISTVEDRQDAFTIIDVGAKDDSIASVVNQVTDLDSNYAATYYPWMQVLDSSINKPIWVPPSVLMPGILAYNDSVSAEWYAPAGLNRGGITDAINVTTKLSHSERDVLYESSINPIASFPGQGICAWGQKTLQQRPSALDRISVRRLLITVKKYIASTSRYLVFEQNTAATRNRFLSIVNPYLESIQQRQGLYAFRVVMDDTNNTPSVIDRNLLVGDIYLQPSKTAEFIVINFNLTPTGMELPA
jgi:phage tail sheath protein FI